MLDRLVAKQHLFLAIALGLLCLSIYAWEISLPNVLSFYDSGTYLASSINLVNGILPYRDFTFVQPPGIALILSPIAFLSKFIGSHDAFTLARWLSAVVSAMNVFLLAWLLRTYGRIAMMIGGLGIGLMPIGAYETAGVKLETFCIFFILLGAVSLLTSQDTKEPLPRRRLIIGGLLFGVAALVKIFAFLPFIGMVIALYPNARRRIWNYVLAAGAAFAIPALPFFIAGPTQFTSEVLIQQLFRKSSPTETLGVAQRFIAMVGLSGTWLSAHGFYVTSILAALAGFVLFVLLRSPPIRAIDSFFIWASIFSASGLLMAAQFINYYGYFSEPFLIGLFAISVARLGHSAKTAADRLLPSPHTQKFVAFTLVAAILLLAVAFPLYTTTYYSNQTRVFGFQLSAVAPVTKLIPQGACVIYDDVASGIVANRWPSSAKNCPHLIDPFGMWLAWGYHLIPAAPGFTKEWMSYFERTQFVVLGKPNSNVIPWNHGLGTWFRRNFHLIAKEYPTYIYERN